MAGLIVGFDSERGSVAESMIECIEETSIPFYYIGLLYALANTQLSRRLQREGRLFPDAHAINDERPVGLNFKTARPRRDILDDYERILERAYRPVAYFERIRRLGRTLRRPKLQHVPIIVAHSLHA